MSEELQVQNRVAKHYAKRYSGTGFLFHGRVVHKMMAGVTMKTKVLDVGCGTGFVSQLYPNYDIIGLDFSPEMLKLNPYKSQLGSADDIPFKANTFDHVTCRALLHHLKRPHDALSEMHRVLNTGGIVSILETMLQASRKSTGPSYLQSARTAPVVQAPDGMKCPGRDCRPPRNMRSYNILIHV